VNQRDRAEPTRTTGDGGPPYEDPPCEATLSVLLSVQTDSKTLSLDAAKVVMIARTRTRTSSGLTVSTNPTYRP
jgi:hypothetical protein